MKSLRRLAAALLVISFPLIAFIAPASAHSGVEHERQAFLFLIDGASYEEMMAVPELRQLARAGGAGLLSIRTVPDDEGLGGYVTIGAGARSWGSEQVRVLGDGSGESVTIDLEAEAAENGGHSVPGLLGAALERADKERAFVLGDAAEAQPPGLLVASDLDGEVPLGTDDAVDLAVYDVDPERLAEALGIDRAGAMRLIGAEIYGVVNAAPADDALVIVASPRANAQMDAARDSLPGVVMASGLPPGLFPPNGPLQTLASDTTRRVGLVSNEDVAPTILEFLEVPVPGEMRGATIEVVDAPPPFAAHRTYLAARELWIPVQVGAGIASLLILVSVAVCWRLRLRGNDKAGVVGMWLSLMVPVLATGLLAAGSLPSPSGWSVAAFLAAITLGVPAAALLLGYRRGPLVPAAIVGGAILSFFLIEGLLGFPSTRFTYLGGTAFEGGRYYGLPNVFLGLLVGSALYLAAVMRPYAGFVLLIAVGLFAGMPSLGSDHGGIVTIFFAAGLWLALRGTWRHLGWKGLVIAAGFALIGAVVVFAADAWLASTPTHGTRFLQAEGVGGVPAGLVRRLGIGVRLLAENPTGIVYLLLTPVLLWWTLKPRAGSRFRTTMERFPRWRAAMAVVLGASVVAYFVNDTGVGAVGLGFAMAAFGLTYVSLLPEPGRMSP